MSTMSQEENTVTDEKVETLLALKEPKTVKEAQSFCGALAYYSRIIPNLSALLSPLQKAFSLKHEFKLTNEMRENIDILKKQIKAGLSASHLHYPDDSEEF